jgi:hypothetical protein
MLQVGATGIEEEEEEEEDCGLLGHKPMCVSFFYPLFIFSFVLAI